MQLDLECPANYFGKGQNYLLPDDAETIREFERRFQEWEIAHPEDPTGELALAAWQAEHRDSPQRPHTPRAESTTEGEISTVDEDEAQWRELELVLPVRHIDKFKNYCRLMRRRPRDVVMLWIEKHCKL